MKYFFITGTSEGLGKAIAEKILKEKNHKVIGLSRKSTIINPNYSHFFIDLLKIETLENELNIIFKSLLSCDEIVLINNAGTVGEIKHIGNTTAENITNIIKVNSISPSIIINSFIKKYKKESYTKVIINISSGAGINPIDGWASYCSSKAMLDMMTKVVFEEQSEVSNGFKILSISPGIIDTQMQKTIRNSNKSEFSNLEKFKAFKSNNELSDPKFVAIKILEIINNINSINEVMFDVRNL